MLENFVMTDDIDKNISTINGIFAEAKEKCTDPAPSKRRHILPDEIYASIKLRKAILKSRKKARSPLGRKILTKIYNRVNHKVQQQMREFKDKQLEDLCGKISDSRSTLDMWKSFNRFKNKDKPIEEPETPLIVPDGSFTSNNKEKCDEFARYLHSVHQTPDNDMFDHDFKQKVDEEIFNEEIVTDESSIKKIYIPQFEKLLSETKANSAPGEDQISYGLMKLCSPNTKQVFCNIINQCLAKNVFPKAWKEAKVRMLPKPGRDKKLACNYRPISLLSCLGKIYERFLYAYLMKELDGKNFLNANQAGFTKGRSAHEHLL